MANRYIANYAAATGRGRSVKWSVGFYAADDAGAAAVAAVIDGYTKAKRVSLVKSLFFDNSGPYPDGTEYTCTAILEDANEDIFRFRARNFNGGPDCTQWDIASLLEGAAFSIGDTDVPALASSPALPNTLSAVSSVKSVNVIAKDTSL